MPNWTENDLTITGSQKELYRFAKFTGKTLDFDKFIPYPAKYAKLDKLCMRRFQQISILKNKLAEEKNDLVISQLQEKLHKLQEKMYKLPDDYAVFSGHGEHTTIGAEKKTNYFVREDSVSF